MSSKQQEGLQSSSLSKLGRLKGREKVEEKEKKTKERRRRKKKGGAGDEKEKEEVLTPLSQSLSLCVSYHTREPCAPLVVACLPTLSNPPPAPARRPLCDHALLPPALLLTQLPATTFPRPPVA